MISLTQTSLWAKLNQHFNGMEPYIFSHDNITCLFGYDVKNGSITAFGGPVVPPETNDANFESFIKNLLAQVKNERIYQVNFRALFPLREWNAKYEKTLLKIGFNHSSWKTLILNLYLPEDELFKNLEHSARKGVKKAINSGVTIFKCSSFEGYYNEFLIPYMGATDRIIKDKSFYKSAWDFDTGNSYNYWVAKDSEGKTLGFLGSYRHDGIANEIMSALTPLAWEKKLPVQDLLHWEIIKFHKNSGDLYFDLAGFNPNPTSDKEKNIKKFKEKWGAVEYDTSSYYIDLRSPILKLFHRLLRKING